MTESGGEYLRIGEVIKPHGIEGELVVDPLTEFPEERFTEGAELEVFRGDQVEATLTVTASRWHQDRLLLATEEVEDRTRAETLRDTWIGVPVDDQVEPEEGYFGHDLIGLDVYTSDGEKRGVLVDVHPDEMNPLAAIELEDGRMDFPLSPDLIEDIQLDESRIVLRFPDGWQKLAEPYEE